MQQVQADSGLGAQKPWPERKPVEAVRFPPDLTRQALMSALAGVFDEPLTPPQGQAVLHPNGFAKVPVAELAGGSQRLFLHAWLRDGEDSHIHNHRWDFSSTVLRGTLRNTVVEVGSDGDGPPYTVVQHRPVKGGFRFDRSCGPPVHISSRRTMVHAERVEYAMDALTLHRVQAVSGTMTLVSRGSPWRSWSEVLLDTTPKIGARRMAPLNDTDRARHLRTALEVLW
ncbi:hypothetical protein ABZ853_09625 [Streptomyces albidoflavus]